MEAPNGLKQNPDLSGPKKPKPLMTRRSFLIYSGVTAIIIAAGLKGYTSFFRSIDPKLVISLEPLFDPKFEKAADKRVLGVIKRLRAKGVIDEEGKINAPIVTKLAKTDRLIVVEGQYYTQTELEIYGLAYLIHNGGDPGNTGGRV